MRRVLQLLVAEWITRYKTKSVHFLRLMNSATKNGSVCCQETKVLQDRLSLWSRRLSGSGSTLTPQILPF